MDNVHMLVCERLAAALVERWGAHEFVDSAAKGSSRAAEVQIRSRLADCELVVNRRPRFVQDGGLHGSVVQVLWRVCMVKA